MASPSSLSSKALPAFRLMPALRPVGAAFTIRDSDEMESRVDAPVVVVARATEPKTIATEPAGRADEPQVENPASNDILNSILGYKFAATPAAYEALRTGAFHSPAFSMSSSQALERMGQDLDLVANTSITIEQPPSAPPTPDAPNPAAGNPKREMQSWWNTKCPNVPWKIIRDVLQMGLGISLKTVGAIFVIRQLADLITFGMQSGFDNAMDGTDPVADNRNALFLSILMTVGQGIVAHKYAGRATSAALTFKRKDAAGEDQIWRVGGAHHDNLVTVLAQIPTAFTGGVGLMNAWNLSGAEFNKAVLFYLVGAVKTLIYCTGRGYLERGGAWIMPSVTYVDGKGDELSPDRVEKLSGKVAMFMLPLTILNSGYIVYALLNGTWANPMTIYSADGKAITHPTVDLEVGTYEARLIPLTYLAMWLAAKTDGCTLELGRPSSRPAAAALEAVRPPPSAMEPSVADQDNPGPPADDPDAPAVRMHVTTDRAKEAANSITVNKFKSWWRTLVESPAAPHVYSVVTGFRIWANLGLNWSLDGRAIEDVNASDMPLGIIGLHAILIGLLELGPIRLINGIGAQATEGTADRDLFDKLHHLFKLQDLIYMQKNNGQPPPDWQTGIIHRKLNAETLHFVAGNKTFDDVRAHVQALRDADLPRRVHQDEDSAFLMYEPKYPSKTMVKEFGNIHVRMPFLPNSRVTSQIMALADELVAPPPPAEESV